MSKEQKISEHTKELIVSYVNECSENGISIKSKSQLFREMKEKYDDGNFPSESTFKRYLNQLNFYLNSSTSYGFREYSHKFNELITYLGMKSHICFWLQKPSLGDIIADKINNYYREELVYCIAVKKLLICFYANNKESQINALRLSKEIPEILSKYIIEELKVEK